jgi:hypothetical protein
VCTFDKTMLLQLHDYHCDREMGRSHFEARIIPQGDSSLQVQWLKDGRPVQHANRIQTHQDFGYVSLTLNPTYPEDTGTYTCLLTNRYGQAQSSASLTSVGMEAMLLDTQHADSLQRIGYLEGQTVRSISHSIPLTSSLFAARKYSLIFIVSEANVSLRSYKCRLNIPSNAPIIYSNNYSEVDIEHWHFALVLHHVLC